jgi:hypothetical protein
VRNLAEAWLTLLNLVVAGLLLLLRTPSADDSTYRQHTFWFCSIAALAGPIVAACK